MPEPRYRIQSFWTDGGWRPRYFYTLEDAIAHKEDHYLMSNGTYIRPAIRFLQQKKGEHWVKVEGYDLNKDKDQGLALS